MNDQIDAASWMVEWLKTKADRGALPLVMGGPLSEARRVADFDLDRRGVLWVGPVTKQTAEAKLEKAMAEYEPPAWLARPLGALAAPSPALRSILTKVGHEFVHREAHMEARFGRLRIEMAGIGTQIAMKRLSRAMRELAETAMRDLKAGLIDLAGALDIPRDIVKDPDRYGPHHWRDVYPT